MSCGSTIQKGHILRVKAGYNPNSSSVGSQIPTFFMFAVASAMSAIIAFHVFGPIRRHLKKNNAFIEAGKQ